MTYSLLKAARPTVWGSFGIRELSGDELVDRSQNRPALGDLESQIEAALCDTGLADADLEQLYDQLEETEPSRGCTSGKPVEGGWSREKLRRYLELVGAVPLEDFVPVLEPVLKVGLAAPTSSGCCATTARTTPSVITGRRPPLAKPCGPVRPVGDPLSPPAHKPVLAGPPRAGAAGRLFAEPEALVQQAVRDVLRVYSQRLGR